MRIPGNLSSTINRITDPVANPGIARIILYLSTAIAFAYLHAFNGWEWHLATMSKLLSFQANNPFQTRILIPLIGNGLARLLPIANVTIFTYLEAVSVFFLLLLFRKLLITIDLVDKNYRSAVDLLALLILVPMFYNYIMIMNLSYPYDMPGMALFTLGLILIVQKKWLLYYVTFVFAVLTRETTGLLVLAILVTHFDRLPRRKLILHLVASVAIWGVIRFVVATIFRSNPGGLYEVHFWENLQFLSGILRFEAAPISVLMTFGGFLPFVLLSLRQQPSILRRWLVMLVPLFAFILVTSVIREVRVFSEMIPILTAATIAPFLLPAKEPVSEQVAAPSPVAPNYLVPIGGTVSAVVLGLVALHFWLVGGNFVANPSFEENLSGWSNVNMDKFERSGENVYHGGYSAHALTSGSQRAQSDVIAVSPGARYRIVAFVKVLKGAARIQLKTLNDGVLAEQQADGKNVWIRLAASVTVPPDTSEVLISIDDNRQPSEFYLDLVELRPR